MEELRQISWKSPPNDLGLVSGQVDVWRVSIADYPPDSVRWMGSILSAYETKRADRFHFETDRHRFIVSHTSLRDILSRYLYRSPQDIEITTGEHGKPAVLTNTELDFNLSHSGDFALIAVASGYKVGVDVEKFRHDMEHEKIAHRFFSEHENTELRRLPDEQKVTGFFNCWTRKEAYIKAHGLGLLLPLDDFDVSLTPDEPVILRATRPDIQEAARWTLFSLDIHSEYAGAVAVQGRKLEFRFWEWNPSQ